MRILILAYHFPPLNAMGAHRPYGWAKAWRALGHEVHVVTPARHAFDGPLDLDFDLSGITVHTAPFLGKTTSASTPATLRGDADRQARWDRFKLATRTLRLGLGMFGEIASLGYFSLVKTGLAVLQSARFDFIISTSPPEVTHLAARSLSARTGVAWIADYRDLWFPDMRVHQFKPISALTGWISRRLLRNARLVSTVSQGLASRLGGFLGRPVRVSYNGFFRDAPGRPASRPWSDERVHIAYTGRLFPKKRDPAILFSALGRAIRTDPELARVLAIDIYGYDEPWLRQLIEEHGVASCVRIYGYVSYENSIAAQRHADYLLFVDWMDKEAEGILTGKLFEYLHSGRPIVCIGARQDSEAANLIRAVRAGAVFTDVEAIHAFLQQIPGRRPMTPAAPDRVQEYSRERQAEVLLEAIQAAIGGPDADIPGARAGAGKS